MKAKDKTAGRDLLVHGPKGGPHGYQDTQRSGPDINNLTSTYRPMSSQPEYTWSSNPPELISSTERGGSRIPEMSPGSRPRQSEMSHRPRGSINANKLSSRDLDKPKTPSRNRILSAHSQ